LRELDAKGLKSDVISNSANLDGKELNPFTAVGKCAQGLERLANQSKAEMQTASRDDGTGRG